MDTRKKAPTTNVVTVAPQTPLEAAVLGAGHFQLDADAAGRDIVCIGHRRLPKVVIPQQVAELASLNQVLGVGGGRAFSVAAGDPWLVTQEPADPALEVPAAEEYLVMGLRPMAVDGRPVRVVSGGTVVRLFLLPWTIPARTVELGGSRHYLVTGNRGVVGDWQRSADGRHGVVVGVADIWVGLMERQLAGDAELALRCDVPVPRIGEHGPTGAVPTSVGVFEGSPPMPDVADDDTIAVDAETSWRAKLPVLLTEGNVVEPVAVPEEVTLGPAPDGPWEFAFDAAVDGVSVSGLF